jgi:hypothetical protein
MEPTTEGVPTWVDEEAARAELGALRRQMAIVRDRIALLEVVLGDHAPRDTVADAIERIMRAHPEKKQWTVGDVATHLRERLGRRPSAQVSAALMQAMRRAVPRFEGTVAKRGEARLYWLKPGKVG